MGEFSTTTEPVPIINKAAVRGAITFRGGSYKTRDANGQVKNVGFLPLQLPEASTLAVQVSKNIIETPLNGGRGSFIEIAQSSNYQITIAGTFITENYEQANDKIKRLNELFKINRSLNIINDYLQSLGINQVVVTGLNLPDLRGGEYQRTYEITCISDTNPEIQNIDL